MRTPKQAYDEYKMIMEQRLASYQDTIVTNKESYQIGLDLALGQFEMSFHGVFEEFKQPFETPVAYIMETDHVLCEECYDEMREDNVGDQDPNCWLHSTRHWHKDDVCQYCGTTSGILEDENTPKTGSPGTCKNIPIPDTYKGSFDQSLTDSGPNEDNVPRGTTKVAIHPVINPDPELRESMEEGPGETKEEWLKRHNIPIPGSPEDAQMPFPEPAGPLGAVVTPSWLPSATDNITQAYIDGYQSGLQLGRHGGTPPSYSEIDAEAQAYTYKHFAV